MSKQPTSTIRSPANGWRWLRTNVPKSSFATWSLAGALTGGTFTLADILVRLSIVGLHPVGWTWRSHGLISLSLYASLGALVGAACWLIGRSERVAGIVTASFALPPRLEQSASSVFMPLVASAFAALWVLTSSFSPPNDAVGWTAFGLAVVLAAAFVAFAPLAHRWLNRRRPRVQIAVAAAGLLLGLGCAWLDMTVLVALYPFVHAVGELLTAALWLVSFVVLLQMPSARRYPRRTFATGAVAVVAAGVFLLAGGAGWAARGLRHTTNHQAYTGRLVARGHQLASAVPEVSRRRPNEETARRSMSRRDERSADACPEAWWPSDAPMAPSPLRAAMPAQPNIAVFYVDTLRYDVANDPRVMPNVARFSRGALNFTHAYATGSDTRSSLPAMIRGSFDMALDDDNTVMRVARTQGLQSAVAIGKSPRQFLSKHVPQFKFDQVVESADADADRKVWGYGANRPTAAHLVDDSLSWLAQPNRKRFFLWQFHYDLHGWKEQDAKELEQRARVLGIPRYRSEERWRYRTIAASIDAEFGRFLRELDRMGLADETVVVFLADHGEGLGYQGFWLHAVFLWEDMVHIPLMMRIPGLEGRRVDTLVSVIDVAPTLVRLLDPGASLLPYQGEDLLTQLEPDRPARRFPVLMRGMVKEQVARLGVVDADGRRKLVLPVDSGQPELYDLTARVPDDVDIAPDEPATVDRLMPIVMGGALNPRERRRHERCQRSMEEPDPGADTLATESRRVNTLRRGTGDPT